jgi:hypothetical protein
MINIINSTGNFKSFGEVVIIGLQKWEGCASRETTKGATKLYSG